MIEDFELVAGFFDRREAGRYGGFRDRGNIVRGVVPDPPRSMRCAFIRKNSESSISLEMQVAC